jgi:hypothetical protein
MYYGRPYGPEESEQPEEGDDSETEIGEDPKWMKVSPVEHGKLDNARSNSRTSECVEERTMFGGDHDWLEFAGKGANRVKQRVFPAVAAGCGRKIEDS